MRPGAWHPLRLARAYWTLLRLPHALVVLFATWIGAALAGVQDPTTIRWMILSMVGLFTGSVALNDCLDVREDQVNAPHRPLVQGIVSHRVAWSLGVALMLSGILFAWFADPVLGGLVVVLSFFSAAYSYVLKDVPLVGNFVVSLVSTSALACWAAYIEVGTLFWLLSAALLCIRFGGELLKTAQDCKGDQLARRRTLATVCGSRPAQLAGLMALLAGLLLAGVPIRLEPDGYLYAIILAMAGILVVTGFMWFVTSKPGYPDKLVRIEQLVMVMLVIGGVAGFPDHPLTSLLP